MNYRKNSKGVTLIALVVTIIVLLILAGVTLKLVAGGDGIIGRSTNAVDQHNEAQVKEKVEMMLQEYAISKRIENISFEDFLKEKKEVNEIDEYEKGQNDIWEIELDGYSVDINEKTLIAENYGVAGLRPKASIKMITAGYVLEGSEVQFNIGITLPAELEGATVTITEPSTGVTKSGDVYSVSQNGTYEFEVKASKDGKEYKTRAIATIDQILEKPIVTVTEETSAGFTINVTNGYPQNINLKYEYYVGNSVVAEKISDKTYKAEGLSAGTSYSVKVRVYIDETNYMESDAITAETKGTEIRTVEDLRNIANNMSGSYQLMNDIDLAGVSWTSIGGNSDIFTGTLDGNGFSIKNLSGTNNDTKVSLFYRLDNATIKNIGLNNVNIYCVNGWGGGSLAYGATGWTKIQNVYLTGTINDCGVYGGALIGSVSGNEPTFENIYIKLTNDIGSDTLADSTYYSVTAKNCIVINGGMPNQTGISNSYYYTTTDGTYGGTALTPETIKNKNTFVGFDFDNIWYMDETEGHPKLRICQ